METRKIMALGKSSLVVSLPKKWLNMNNIVKGDTLSLEVQKDMSLLIHPFLKSYEKQKRIVVVIDSDAEEESIIRIIIGCYLNGYNTVQLTSKKIFTIQQQRAIRSVVKSLYLRIIESNASEVILQTLMDESKASVQSGLERMHIITSSMGKDVLNAMKTWDPELASSVVSLEDDVDQFMFYMLRLLRCAANNPALAKRFGIEVLDCLDYQILVDRIECVADCTNQIANDIIILEEMKEAIPDELWNIFIKAAEIVFDTYDKAVETFMNRDVEKSNVLIDKKKEVAKLLHVVTPLPSVSTDDHSALFHLVSIRDQINRVGEYSADISEITINRSYVPQDEIISV